MNINWICWNQVCKCWKSSELSTVLHPSLMAFFPDLCIEQQVEGILKSLFTKCCDKSLKYLISFCISKPPKSQGWLVVSKQSKRRGYQTVLNCPKIPTNYLIFAVLNCPSWKNGAKKLEEHKHFVWMEECGKWRKEAQKREERRFLPLPMTNRRKRYLI